MNVIEYTFIRYSHLNDYIGEVKPIEVKSGTLLIVCEKKYSTFGLKPCLSMRELLKIGLVTVVVTSQLWHRKAPFYQYFC